MCLCFQVQCQLADTSQGLLLEITALRAKIAEMREQSLTQEMDIRFVDLEFRKIKCIQRQCVPD